MLIALLFLHIEPFPLCRSPAMQSSHRLAADSWIEINSQASSSSTSLHTNSSPGLAEEQQWRRRRRRLPRNAASGPTPTTHLPSYGSSQPSSEASEEDEESDRLLSSNEHLNLLPANTSPLAPSSSSDDPSTVEDDDSATALGMGKSTSHLFTPPANAFSHPPSYNSARTSRPLSPRGRHTSAPTHRLSPSRRLENRRASAGAGSHSPYNMIAPSHRTDHDAALRASLSTLLSCAAALKPDRSPDLSRPALQPPKPQSAGRMQRGEDGNANANVNVNAVQPSTLRLVPESSLQSRRRVSPARQRERDRDRDLKRRDKNRSSPSDRNATTPLSNPHGTTDPSQSPRKRPRSSSPPVTTAATTSNHVSPPTKAQAPSQSQSQPHTQSQSQTTTPTPTPSMITSWALTTGAIVLLSVVSFSAGYVVGREMGRAEVACQRVGGWGGGCARDVGVRDIGGIREGVGRGLRRLRVVAGG